MAFPEYVEQLFEAHNCRVKIDLHGFRMVSQAVISRVFLFPAGVADTGCDYTFYAPEPGVNAPESPQGKGGSLNFRWRPLVDEGDVI